MDQNLWRPQHIRERPDRKKVRIHEDNEDTLAGTGEHVTRDSKAMQNSRMSTGKPAAKARPKQASAPSSSSFSTGKPSHSRKWIDWACVFVLAVTLHLWLSLPYPWPPLRHWLLSGHCRIRRPLPRFHETRSMALWLYPHLPQVMSPTWPTIPNRGHRFVLPGLDCDVHLRPWRQRRGVPWRWDRRRARQECAGFNTVHPGARSKCEPVASLSLQWRKLVTRCTVNLSKHGWTRCMVVTEKKIRPGRKKRNDCSQKQHPHHLFQRVYQVIQENEWMSNRVNNMPGVTRLQWGWIHCFDPNTFLETKMEQLTFGRL